MDSFHKNPRLWTESDREKLHKNLIELGDISGVVHDLNTNEIPCGNFRSSIIDINSCEIEIVKQIPEPDAQGTVAHGFISLSNRFQPLSLEYQSLRHYFNVKITRKYWEISNPVIYDFLNEIPK